MDRTPDIRRIEDRARTLSKSLLGAQFRAEIAAFIAVGEGPFWARAMSEQLGVPENKISAELSRFAANNLLVAISVAAWDRRRLYERATKSESYWAAGLELIEAAAQEEAFRIGSEAEGVMDAYLRSVHRDGLGGGGRKDARLER